MRRAALRRDERVRRRGAQQRPLFSFAGGFDGRVSLFGPQPAKACTSMRELRAFARGGLRPAGSASCRSQRMGRRVERAALCRGWLRAAGFSSRPFAHKFPLPAGAVAPKARAGKGTKPRASTVPPCRSLDTSFSVFRWLRAAQLALHGCPAKSRDLLVAFADFRSGRLRGCRPLAVSQQRGSLCWLQVPR